MELPIQENNTLTIFNNLINEGKKITNSIIDTIVSENQNPTNLLNIQVPFLYAINLVHLNWNDMLFAIEHDYFHYSSAIDYASMLIDEHINEDDPIFKLACIFPSEIVKQEILDQFVIKFAEKISEKCRSESKKKIMYVVLNFLFENRNFFEDILYVMEEIRNSFNFPYTEDTFPKSISENMVRYLSTKEPESSSIFKNYEKKFLYNWQKYLEDQKLKFGKTKV